MSRAVWHAEHRVAFNPPVEVHLLTALRPSPLHVDGVRVANASDHAWVTVRLQVTEFEDDLPAVTIESLKRLRWSVEHRRVFVEDPMLEGVWTPVGSSALDRIVCAVVGAARTCDASVRRSFA